MKFKPCLLLQKRALENECGIPGNPLKISWLDGFSSSTDANSETISEHSNPTRSCSDGAAVDSKVALWSKIFYWGIKWNSTYLLIFLGLLTCVFSALVHLIFVTDHSRSYTSYYFLFSYQLPEPSFSSDSTISDKDYESVVLMKLRQFEERKRLIKQMQEDDEQWSRLAALYETILLSRVEPIVMQLVSPYWQLPLESFSVILGGLTRPAVQLFKVNKEAETTLILSS